MKETRIPNLNVDPVGKRLERIIEEKKETNAEALGKIKSLTDSWEELNKIIEGDIKDEFALMDLEDQALVEAIGDLQENSTTPVKDAFTVTGKVLSKKENISLPNVTVVLSKSDSRKNKPLASASTDNLGNFVFRISPDSFGDNDEQRQTKVEFQVFAADGTLLHNEVQSLSPRLGGIAIVTLAMAETDVVSNQLEAGKAVRDSIIDSQDLIALRVDNMRGAHNALAKMADIARDELDTLHEELSVTPPVFKSGDDKPGTPDNEKEPTLPGGGEQDKSDDKEEERKKEEERAKEEERIKEEEERIKDEERAKEEERKKEEEQKKEEERKKEEELNRENENLTPGLADLTGISPQHIKKLKRSRINDLKTFIATDNEKLQKILGDMDFTALKKEAKALLRNG